ncbi:SPOR domain-containing protein [Gemmatimonadota bacterium DH-20]|uniref:SPOR domain-containing protein n=1 Tax=Gaopeijia maritima TaxID=3119007 RepID=A0ABU9ECD7_9BACT
MTRRIPLQMIPLLALAGVASFTAAPLAGQSLHLAELFVEQGRLDDARAEVGAWFEIRGDAATAEEVQHGLWLQGRLLEDRVAARRDLERLVASYPEGPYTAFALTWLADHAAQEGNESAAMAYQARVVKDFPESEAAATARDWLDARGLSVEPPAPESMVGDDRMAQAAPVRSTAVAVDPPADSSATGGEPADAAARLPARADSAASMAAPDSAVATPLDTVPEMPAVEVPAVGSRPDPVSDPPTDTAATPSAAAVDTATTPVTLDPAPTEAATPPAETVATPPAETVVEEVRVPVAASGQPVPGAAEGGAFAVQIGAFRNADGAGGLVDELVAAGFDARLVGVPESSLYRVRIGRYADLDQAGAELARVREAGHDGAVVNDARRELTVSR